MRADCYSGIFHTASLFVDINKIFDKKTTTDSDWALFAVEPLLTSLQFLKALNQCTNNLNFYEEYNQLEDVEDVDFTEWGFELNFDELADVDANEEENDPWADSETTVDNE